MKTSIIYLILTPTLIAVLNLIPVGRATAQIFRTLHSFTAYPNYTNTDGANPNGFVLSGNILYGTAANGGSSQAGTVFKVNTDGAGFTTLHSFTPGSDGVYPYAGLVLTNNTLYGTTSQGGSSGVGTIFAINTDGSGFTTLHSFTATTNTGPPDYSNANSDGANLFAGLILLGNTLYGTATYGGSSGNGTVFAVNTDGSGFANLHSFAAAAYDPNSGVYTNNDGANPRGGLVFTNNTLYGTTYYGGSSGAGTVFRVNTDGTGLRACFENANFNYNVIVQGTQFL